MYKSIFRPLLFQIDAEDIHNKIVKSLQFYRYLTPVRKIVRSSCHTETAGWKWKNLTFKNRVGLSAGFDKAANCFDELSDLGFGFIEVGTVTPKEVKEIHAHAYSAYLKIRLLFHEPDLITPGRLYSYKT